MSAVATSERRARLMAPLSAERSAPRLFEPPRSPGGISLEDLILGVWEDLEAGPSAECPVCGGRLRLGFGCDGCGSELS